MAEKKKEPAKKAPAKKAPAKAKPAPAKKSVLALQKDNILESLKRTLIPIAVGAISASFIGPYIDQATLRDLMGALIAAVYYTVVRFVETKKPQAGILLGSTSQPQYK